MTTLIPDPRPAVAATTPPPADPPDLLDMLESEALHIIREVVGESSSAL